MQYIQLYQFKFFVHQKNHILSMYIQGYAKKYRCNADGECNPTTMQTRHLVVSAHPHIGVRVNPRQRIKEGSNCAVRPSLLIVSHFLDTFNISSLLLLSSRCRPDTVVQVTPRNLKTRQIVTDSYSPCTFFGPVLNPLWFR